MRMLLIQQSEPSSTNLHPNKTPHDKKASTGEEEEIESKDDMHFLQISIALSHLLRSARELASGLMLPEVGLDVSVVSTLVDRTVDLAEILVRRCVAIKFQELRVVVAKECLAPLVREVVWSNAGRAEDVITEEGTLTVKGGFHAVHLVAGLDPAPPSDVFFFDLCLAN